MISPELLRRHSFFAFLDEAQLKAIAMISEEARYEKGVVIVEADQPANALYVLVSGDASLYFVVTTPNDPYYNKEYFISDINPGEVFGISALIAPYKYSTRVCAGARCKTIRINAETLRALCTVDSKMASGMLTVVARTAMERLVHTRIQLIAAQQGK